MSRRLTVWIVVSQIVKATKITIMLNGKSILVTGGTGSFGRRFVEVALARYPALRRVIIFSRDELKQHLMAQTTSGANVEYVIGDVRDRHRLLSVASDVDIIIHAAALKHVTTCERNVGEAIQTNLLGAVNVVECAIATRVSRVVALSTDKAVAAANLYGATKFAAERVFVAANASSRADLAFGLVRYGNVWGSRGSVVPTFVSKIRRGVPLSITDTRMTRFSITLDESVDAVLYALEHMSGGEVFIPKCASYRLVDLVEAIAPGQPFEIAGIRPGEKIHEELLTSTEARLTLELAKYFVIVPASLTSDAFERFFALGGAACPEGFTYASGNNTNWLTMTDLRQLIEEHIKLTHEN